MASVLMMLLAADCLAIGTVARYMVGLFAGVGLSGITEQLASLSVTISSAIMTGLSMGWVTTLGLASTLWRVFSVVGCSGALTTFFKCCVGSGNATAKGGPAGSRWYVLLSVGLPSLAPEAGFWLLRQGRV